MTDSWNPDQYEQFKRERELPFRDLLAMIQVGDIASCIDLGCGTGRLTLELHRRTRAEKTLGIDSSAEMLAGCEAFGGSGIEFLQADLRSHEPPKQVDLVFSNAALHWIDEQREVLEQIASWLAPGGQLAVQVPANFDHISHLLAASLAREEPFASAVGTWKRGNPVLKPEKYATLLRELGFSDQRVQLIVYPHVLDSVDSLIEWQKGTLLTVYRDRLGEPLYTSFLEEFRQRLVRELGQEKPLFYPFKRILFWARR